MAEPACAKVECPKTVDTFLSQVSVGLAWWYRQYAREKLPEDRQRYEFAETEARAKKAGLWAEKEPMPPWEFRHGGLQIVLVLGHKRNSIATNHRTLSQ